MLKPLGQWFWMCFIGLHDWRPSEDHESWFSPHGHYRMYERCAKCKALRLIYKDISGKHAMRMD